MIAIEGVCDGHEDLATGGDGMLVVAVNHLGILCCEDQRVSAGGRQSGRFLTTIQMDRTCLPYKLGEVHPSGGLLMQYGRAEIEYGFKPPYCSVSISVMKSWVIAEMMG
jgi:hypothetical protein